MSIKSNAPVGATNIYQDNSFKTHYCFYCKEVERWMVHDPKSDSWNSKDLSQFLIEEII